MAPLLALDSPGRPRIALTYDAEGRLEAIGQVHHRRGLRLTYKDLGRHAALDFFSSRGAGAENFLVLKVLESMALRSVT